MSLPLSKDGPPRARAGQGAEPIGDVRGRGEPFGRGRVPEDRGELGVGAVGKAMRSGKRDASPGRRRGSGARSAEAGSDEVGAGRLDRVAGPSAGPVSRRRRR